uniref:Uncharacterized protein n=1 Tax=Glossina morsitans morsitans TaxID=37546 RepID=A0A1B0G8Y5_GLOMM
MSNRCISVRLPVSLSVSVHVFTCFPYSKLIETCSSFCPFVVVFLYSFNSELIEACPSVALFVFLPVNILGKNISTSCAYICTENCPT